MSSTELHETARAIVADHKGILAADESTGTMTKRLASIGVESTPENRRSFRGLLFSAPGMEEYIGGVILYDETIRQAADDGTPFPELLASKGVIPGIKVDTGAHDLAGFPGEKVTEGLDGLRGRLEEYRGLGARFAKWRAVIAIGDGIPTGTCIRANAHALARYAALCQEQGLVPIVEPEVLMDGDNTIERCYEVTAQTLHAVYDLLFCYDVDLRGTLLKPNMVISGKGCPEQATAAEIAEQTIRCFLDHVPASVPGIVFLSGGQSEIQATENLNAINRVGGPWTLSFSYGRALQASALKAWAGDPANAEAAQAAFVHRARMNSLAAAGAWSAELEQPVAA
ncbi:MAG: class I fructose-bisphosphate aldolase [Thermoleophilia bacterium]|nr:fructose-bisphosphate aldolase class I [Gaiellaceae bacterium]MDW8338081.1 class I fructose-bisphosphate aldolase [Thermoleophilia bacterium]